MMIGTSKSLLYTLLLISFCAIDNGNAESVHLESPADANVSAEEEEEAESDYLYDGQDAEPVIEYLRDSEVDPEHPRFIYDPNNGPRIVEFYAPWCPHCQEFRDHYIQFANQLSMVAQELGVDDIKSYAVSCVVHKNVCKAFEVHGYPQLRLFAKGATNVTAKVNYWELHPFSILNALGIEVNQLKVSEAQLHTIAQGKHLKLSRSRVGLGEEYRRTKQDIYDDAYLSFDFNLRNGIFVSGDTLSNSTKTALLHWLALLQMSLPPVWHIQKVIRTLLNDFETITNSEKELLSVLDRFQPPKKTWSKSCTKGRRGMGYTCGIWELFHIMTVGVVEWNLMLNGDQLDDMAVSVVHAAETLRGFIANFFGCEVCRVNFLTAYDACSLDRCHRLRDDASDLAGWLQLPVWLFETHNAVNVRLMKEKAKRNSSQPTHMDEIRVQWPARDTCPKCWRQDGSWDEEMVYKYLRVEYWPEDFVTEEYRRLSSQKDMDYDDSHGFSFWWSLVLVAPLGSAICWYTKKIEMKRSGFHKKVDSYDTEKELH